MIEPVNLLEKCRKGLIVCVGEGAKRENGWLSFSSFDLRDKLSRDVGDDG